MGVFGTDTLDAADCTTPTNRREWWLEKLNGNVVRDRMHSRALRKLGWKVVVVWECQIGNDAFSGRLIALSQQQSSDEVFGELATAF